MPLKDKKSYNAYHREYGRLKAAKNRADGKCSCGGPRITGRKGCQKCLLKFRTTTKTRLQKLKKQVVAAYGGKCECCGETEIAFLTIDHVNDDGAEHRRQITTRIYDWLKKRDFPKEGFRLLCFNCNLGRRINGGICPHVLSQES